jgi:hypothetical protein
MRAWWEATTVLAAWRSLLLLEPLEERDVMPCHVLEQDPAEREEQGIHLYWCTAVGAAAAAAAA